MKYNWLPVQFAGKVNKAKNLATFEIAFNFTQYKYSFLTIFIQHLRQLKVDEDWFSDQTFKDENLEDSTCNDEIQNQGETDVDCGGPCDACPSCDDDIQNQGETDVDCGGPCTMCEGMKIQILWHRYLEKLGKFKPELSHDN